VEQKSGLEGLEQDDAGGGGGGGSAEHYAFDGVIRAPILKTGRGEKKARAEGGRAS